MRFNSLLIIAFALLSAVLALPVGEPEDYGLSKRTLLVDDELALRSDDESDILIVRDDVELFGRGRKVTLGPKARQDIKAQGFRGNARRREEKRHKVAAKAYMRGVPGAHSAKIQRAAHTGGTNPNERRHATVAVYGKGPNGGKRPIKSHYVQNGRRKTGALHHVYM